MIGNRELRRLSWLLLAAGAWTLYVWGTRVWLLFRQDEGLSFLLVHLLIAAVSLAFGAALLWWGWRLRGRERSDMISES